MAGERTRRFTRNLLRPGQAAELRHSAAAAASTNSRRHQLRVSPPAFYWLIHCTSTFHFLNKEYSDSP
uniref:Uncharacterized protein n=1 Tax=Sphenodon punctatus TaxID=8508 RepID=A0A8D0G905_SPHPU